MIHVAVLTVVEVARRRFALLAAIGVFALAAMTGWGLHAMRAGIGAHPHAMGESEARQMAAFMLPFISFLFSFVLAFAAAMSAATMLSAEVESGVLLPVLARPISRSAVVGGKALGLALVVAAFAALYGLVEYSVVFAMTGFVPPHPISAIGALAGAGIAVMLLTLALASRLQAIASGLVAILGFGFAWFAGIAGSLAAVYKNETLVHAATVAQLILPTDALWRVSAFALEPAIFVAQLQQRGAWAGPFFVTTPPPPAMMAWAVVWAILVLAIAARSFSTRDV
ncbi:MAG TPA: ABC transporter permease subunit [Candidatus Acidoferrales bacterium]|nr:ABC transporter permease subunit [Candidatus Acidoferrales bacterium]